MHIASVRVVWWQRYIVASGVLLALLALIWTGIVFPAAFWYCAFWPVLITLPAFVRDQQGFRVACFAVGIVAVALGLFCWFFGWFVFAPAGLPLIIAGATRVRRGGVSR